jgi:hypothetical protein
MIKQKEGRPRLVTTSWPSSNYEKTVNKLLQCCGNFQEHQKCAAQEALGNVLSSSPVDCYLIVRSTIQKLMGKLRDGVGLNLFLSGRSVNNLYF